LAVTLFFIEKIHQSAALFWFGLQIVRVLQIFYSQAVIPRTIVESLTFLEHSSAEKIAVIVHIQPVIPTRRMIRGILYEPAQNFEVFSNIQN
jgi:hypothetical protein